MAVTATGVSCSDSSMLRAVTTISSIMPTDLSSAACVACMAKKPNGAITAVVKKSRNLDGTTGVAPPKRVLGIYSSPIGLTETVNKPIEPAKPTFP